MAARDRRLMDGAALLSAYVRLHDLGDWSALSRLFADEGELRFHGLPVPVARGPAAIERLFRERPPTDRLVLGVQESQRAGAVSALYGWRASPDHVDGRLWLVPAGGRIARLDVHVLPAPVVPAERRAARALVVEPGGSVLLLAIHERATGGRWWATPGGGVEPGEDERAALCRELREEVGLEAEPGPCLWIRTHAFVWQDRVLRQRERVYLVRVDEPFAPRPAWSAELLAGEGVSGHRWWSPSELLATDEVFAPRALPTLVCDLSRDGAPATPADLGL